MLIDGVIMLLKGQLNETDQSGYTGLLAALIAANGAAPGADSLPGSAVFENELPRGYQLPAIAVHQYGGTQDYDFGGPLDVVEDQVQLDCYGKDSASCRALSKAAKDLLQSYVGILPDGTVVQAVFKERDQAMPFLPNADQKGIANRWMLGFRVISKRV